MRTRTTTTGRSERRGHHPAVAAGAVALASGAMAAAARHRYRNWGATAAERALPLPGDQLIDDVGSQWTRAITVHAPPSEVWHWLVQLGLDPGGWYNDEGSKDGYAFRVAEVDPGRALVLRQTPPEHPWDATWAFVLIPDDWGGTRVLVRNRAARQQGVAGRLTMLGGELLDPVTLVMTRKVLLQIKARAEYAHQKRLRDLARSEHRLAA